MSKKPKYVSTNINLDGTTTVIHEYEKDENEVSVVEEMDRSKIAPYDFKQEELAHHTDQSPCYLCRYHFGKSRTKNNAMDKIYQAYLDNSDASFDEVAMIIFKKHEELIVNPELKKGNMNVLRLPVEKIKQHLRFYTNNFLRAIDDKIRHYSIIEDNIERTLFTKGPDGIPIPDKLLMSTYLKVGSCKLSMINARRNFN